jgi:lysozyme family protein
MSNFEEALSFVLRNEDARLSGVVTEDSGGRTRFGIAERFHPELGNEFYRGTREAALETAREICRRDYWESVYGDEIRDEAVAAKLLDMAVNMGVRQAVALCQRAVNAIADFPITEDGVMGPRTVAAMNSCETSVLAAHLCDACSGFYRHLADVRPEMQRYLSGWLARAQKIPSGKPTAPGEIG